MTNHDIELKLKKTVEACTPDVLDKVLAGCEEKQDKVISIQKRRSSFPRWIAVAAACALFAGVGVFGMMNQTANRIVSTVAFEVNPSIELKLNKKEEVVKVNALNKDAEKILEGMKLEGTDVRTATNAIIGSLLKNGYIDELANSILLSVEDDDAAHGEKLQNELAEEINAILKGASINAAILSQYVKGDDVDDVSKEYQISHGKAALINQIMAVNSAYQFEELAALSVNELNLILSNSKNNVTGVQATGNASDGAFIGAENAKIAALQHAGVVPGAVLEWDVEMDYEHHRMVYEVEFETANGEYEYDIDAKTGEVVSNHNNVQAPANQGPTNQGSGNTDYDDRNDDDDDDDDDWDDDRDDDD